MVSLVAVNLHVPPDRAVSFVTATMPLDGRAVVPIHSAQVRPTALHLSALLLGLNRACAILQQTFTNTSCVLVISGTTTTNVPWLQMPLVTNANEQHFAVNIPLHITGVALQYDHHRHHYHFYYHDHHHSQVLVRTISVPPSTRGALAWQWSSQETRWSNDQPDHAKKQTGPAWKIPRVSGSPNASEISLVISCSRKLRV